MGQKTDAEESNLTIGVIEEYHAGRAELRDLYKTKRKMRKAPRSHYDHCLFAAPEVRKLMDYFSVMASQPYFHPEVAKRLADALSNRLLMKYTKERIKATAPKVRKLEQQINESIGFEQ